MQMSLKRYLRLLVATALYLVVGFLIDKERFAWWVAIALFWLVVIVWDGRRRNNTNRQG